MHRQDCTQRHTIQYLSKHSSVSSPLLCIEKTRAECPVLPVKELNSEVILGTAVDMIEVSRITRKRISVSAAMIMASFAI